MLRRSVGVIFFLSVVLRSVTSSSVNSTFTVNEVLRQNFLEKWPLIFIGILIFGTIFHSYGDESLVSAFSLRKNFPSLLNIKENKNFFTCLDGLRVISQFYVIISHFTLAIAWSPKTTFNNPEDVEKVSTSQITYSKEN